MAIVTSTSGPKYAIYSGAVVSATPLTMAAWMYPLNVTEDHYPIGISAASGLNNWGIALYGNYTGFGTDKVAAFCDDGTPPAGYAVASGSFTANSWQHVCGVFTSSTSRTCYRDGGNSGSDTTNRTPTCNRTMVGALMANGTAYGATCRIAEAAFWSAALTAAEVASLAQGVCPLDIRPASLVAYYPCGGHYGRNSKDRWKNKYDMTDTNSPTYTDHARVIYPQAFTWPRLGFAAAPTTKYWIFNRKPQIKHMLTR